MKYRAEIDGLRTLAVLPVLFFHAGFSQISGGFIGVDIFFVISGYLITTILIGELDEGRFSILRFYERRFRRILPALFIVIACTIPMAWIQLDPQRFTDFSQSILACMAFVSNILFWSEAGYFDTDAENKPLLHTWSLAVEEQYYLFFPVMLFLLWRYGRRSTLGMIIVLTLGSFGLCEWMSRHASSANFYLLPSRMWELFAGSICAFALPHLRGNQWLAGLGLALIAGGIVLIDGTMRFPSAVTLVPVLGAVLIVLFARKGTWVARVLSWKPIVGIGLVSYSLYLWHQPIFAIARLKFGHRLGEMHMLALIGLALILAILTWRFIEQPFRGKRAFLPRQRQIFTASATGMVVFAAFGLMGVTSQGAAFRYPEGYQNFLLASERPSYHCITNSSTFSETFPLDGCFNTATNPQAKAMQIGDSHGWAISPIMIEMAKAKNISLYPANMNACAPIPGLYWPKADRPDACSQFTENALGWAAKHEIDTLILVARFTLLFEETGYDNGQGGIETNNGRISTFSNEFDPNESKETRLIKLRHQMLDRLVGLSREFKLIIVEPIPEAGWNVPGAGINLMKDIGKIPYLSTSYESYHRRNDPTVSLLHDVQARAEKGRVTLVRVDDLFCHEDTGRCDNIVDGLPLYFDDDHVSNAGAHRIVPRIVEALLSQKQGN
ncbi:acyltransferase family protein [Thioclava kandeliae]|uniref:Acyltransferase family protein n=1 Tax=Thioclava kandeliae TaxID=3070818 RepID=A0ABV1SN86_9RHOB